MRFFYLPLFIVAATLSAYSQDLREEFSKADSISKLYPRHSLYQIHALAQKLTKDLVTEQGKFRAIYKWVCLNVDNDFKLAQVNKKNRAKLNGEELAAWNSKLIPVVNKKLMEDYSTICNGYAWLIQQLSYHAGLDCKIIHGYGRTSQSNIGGDGIVNHTWNAIKLNNQWYLCDATWSSGALDLRTSSFVRNYEDAYFLSDPAFFIRNHYPLDTRWILLEHFPTLEFFLRLPVVYTAAFDHKIQSVEPGMHTTTIAKDSDVTFTFTCEQIFPKTAKLVIGSLETRDVARISNNVMSIRHLFTNRGTFVVHLTLAGKPVYSYLIKVK